MLPSFKDMKVPEQIIEALKNMGISDVIARAQTGTGKTLAFLVPLAQRIDVTKNYAQALIVTPTRELAQQIAAELKRLTGKESAVKVLAVTGGRDFELQKHKLENTCHVLIGTPGRPRKYLPCAYRHAGQAFGPYPQGQCKPWRCWLLCAGRS